MILPTGTNAEDSQMTTAKRQTLADFMYYSLCQGQKEMGPIGYSPLPINLVTAGFSQLAKLQVADSGVDLTQRDASTCNNPTFIPGQPTRNYLAEIAPQPAACDKSGAGPCGFTAPQTANPTGAPGSTTSAAPSGGATAAPGAGGRAGGTAAPAAGNGNNAGTTPAGGAGGGTSGSSPAACPVDPDTGQPASTCGPGAIAVGGGDSTQDGTPTGDGTTGAHNSLADAQNVPTTLVADRGSSGSKFLAGVAALELLAALVVPILIGRRFERNRRAR